MITLPLAIKYLTNDAYQREVDGEYDAIHFDECLGLVIEAAQQPRQEWMDMEPTAYRVSVDSCIWFFDTPNEARDYIRMHLSEGGALITPLYKLPKPPKDKP